MTLTSTQIAYAKAEGCAALAEQILGADSSIDQQFEFAMKLKRIVYAKSYAKRYAALERQADRIGNYNRI